MVWRTTETAKHFMDYLEDTANDFQRSKTALGKLAGAAVCGLVARHTIPKHSVCQQRNCTFFGRLGARDLFVDAKESDHVSVGLADDTVGDMDGI